jgi:hypothetical protein
VSLWIKPIILESSLLKYPITKGITRVKQNKIISRLLRIFKSKKSKLSFTPFNNYTSSKVTLYKAIMVFVSGCAQVLTCIPKFEVTLKLLGDGIKVPKKTLNPNISLGFRVRVYIYFFLHLQITLLENIA